MASTTTSHQPASRLVVLLKPGDKKRLQKLAREENVSSSEIVRRSLQSYSSQTAKDEAEEAELKASLTEMGETLDQALLTIRSARLEIAANLSDIKKIRAEHA